MKEISNVSMGIDKISNSPLVFLRVEDSNLVVPIWIGPCEAGVLALILRKEEFERPLTHDLILSVIQKLGAKPLKVMIDRFKKDIFYAKLVLKDVNSKEIKIDARPSDCIIIALKENIPIYIDESIVHDHAIDSSLFYDFNLEESEEEKKDFRKEIDNFDIDELRRRFENKENDEDDDE